LTYKINKLQRFHSFMIPILFGFFVGVLVSKSVYQPDKEVLDKQFNEIYKTLEGSSQYLYNISDTQIRISHYATPHTEFEDLCPECGDLWGKKKENVVAINTEELERLRALTGLYPPNVSDHDDDDEPVELTVEEELESILHLLKSTKAMLYTTMYAGEISFHNLAKTSCATTQHNHEVPGVIGGCPDCKDLRSRQTNKLSFISKQEYEKLIAAEKDINNAKK